MCYDCLKTHLLDKNMNITFTPHAMNTGMKNCTDTSFEMWWSTQDHTNIEGNIIGFIWETLKIHLNTYSLYYYTFSNQFYCFCMNITVYTPKTDLRHYPHGLPGTLKHAQKHCTGCSEGVSKVVSRAYLCVWCWDDFYLVWT